MGMLDLHLFQILPQIPVGNFNPFIQHMTYFLCWGLRQNEVHGLPPVTLSSRDGRLQSSAKILSSLHVVFCFAQETYECAYDAFTHVMFLVHDINVVH
jgi:hypothetical protein